MKSYNIFILILGTVFSIVGALINEGFLWIGGLLVVIYSDLSHQIEKLENKLKGGKK